jgi:hypothetical protein
MHLPRRLRWQWSENTHYRVRARNFRLVTNVVGFDAPLAFANYGLHRCQSAIDYGMIVVVKTAHNALANEH